MRYIIIYMNGGLQHDPHIYKSITYAKQIAEKRLAIPGEPLRNWVRFDEGKEFLAGNGSLSAYILQVIE